MSKPSQVFAGITAFFYIGIFAGCTSPAINVRNFSRDGKLNTENAAIVSAEPRTSQTISMADHIPTVVAIVGFLNKPPDADIQENKQEQISAPDGEHTTLAVHYDTIKDPRAQGNRPTKNGTGFIVETSGEKALIATNNHVQRNTDNLTVLLYDGREYPARTVWTSPNPDFDIAFLEIKKRNPADPNEVFAAVKLGDSDAVSIGDRYRMIGHPYGLLFYSVHTGTLAQTRSSFFAKGYSVLQMNMNIYPGNSGSPLINERGEVDGIVYAVKVDTKNNWLTAIGWAIPINPVKEKLKEIMEKTGP